MTKQKKIGILGGTFDPIHYGHLILCQTAYEKFGLDFVLVMPSKNPPHKAEHPITDAKDRTEMVRLAIQNDPRFFISQMEMHREGYTYTCETLQLLSETYPDTHFYFIMGADSIYDFEKWKNPQQIASLCTLLAANRSEKADQRLECQIQKVREQFHADIHLLHIPGLDISSRLLRGKIAAGESIQYYTPDEVIRYIENRHLYSI